MNNLQNIYTFSYAFESANATDIIHFLDDINRDYSLSSDDLIILCDMETDIDNKYNYIIKVKDDNNIKDWFWPTLLRTKNSQLDPPNDHTLEIVNAFGENLGISGNRSNNITNEINDNLKTLYNEHFDLVISSSEEHGNSLYNIKSNMPEISDITLSNMIHNNENKPITIDRSKLDSNVVYGYIMN